MTHSILCRGALSGAGRVLVLLLLAAAGCTGEPFEALDFSLDPGRDGARPDAPRPDSGPPPPTMRVHTIDVGTGLCVLVELPGQGQPVLLADCGQDVWKGAGVPASATVGYARRIIGKRAVALVLSHAHSDHYSLVDNVIGKDAEALELTTAWLGGRLDDYSADGGRVFNLLSELRKQHPDKVHDDLASTYRSPYPGGEPQLTFGPVKVYVLAVNATLDGPKKNTNGTSMVILIKYGAFLAVLPGDATGAAQVLAAQHARAMGLPLSQAALLLASHHGAGTDNSNDAAWAAEVKPQLVIYSAGRDVSNAELKMHNGHPYVDVVGMYGGLSSLGNAKEHQLYQGLSGSKAQDLKTRKAHFLSASNGTVVVSANGQKGDLSVRCEAHPGTSRDTNCALTGP